MALWFRDRNGDGNLSGLVHHSDADSACVSIHYTDQLQTGTAPPVGMGPGRWCGVCGTGGAWRARAST
ncbi:hypothetical protein SSP35_47_00050 [Streptomyces sp. NBRC 110611]|nr:hypothetical protein SSP35_47_00050 [Streptomyces sp. NBRC 110611]